MTCNSSQASLRCAIAMPRQHLRSLLLVLQLARLLGAQLQRLPRRNSRVASGARRNVPLLQPQHQRQQQQEVQRRQTQRRVSMCHQHQQQSRLLRHRLLRLSSIACGHVRSSRRSGRHETNRRLSSQSTRGMLDLPARTVRLACRSKDRALLCDVRSIFARYQSLSKLSDCPHPRAPTTGSNAKRAENASLVNSNFKVAARARQSTYRWLCCSCCCA